MIATTTRTARIRDALLRELERRREQIDADHELRSVSVIVSLPDRLGAPVRVIFRTESQTHAP